jgi:hypothetical protein
VCCESRFQWKKNFADLDARGDVSQSETRRSRYPVHPYYFPGPGFDQGSSRQDAPSQDRIHLATKTCYGNPTKGPTMAGAVTWAAVLGGVFSAFVGSALICHQGTTCCVC